MQFRQINVNAIFVKMRWFHGINPVKRCFHEFSLLVTAAHCGNYRKLLSPKKIPSNHLFSNFFSENFTFTKSPLHNVRIWRIFSVKSTYTIAKSYPIFPLQKPFFWEKLILPNHSKHVAVIKIEAYLVNFNSVKSFAAQNRTFGV